MRSIEERFWVKVDKISSLSYTDCWVWIGCKNPKGYGQFWGQDKMIGAHRYSWILKKGSIPNDLCVLHKCDNPPCVNPDHLFLGTQSDNMKDMAQKGRHVSPNKQKLSCPKGHLYSSSNLYISPNGYRGCKICRAAQVKAFKTKYTKESPSRQGTKSACAVS